MAESFASLDLYFLTGYQRVLPTVAKKPEVHRGTRRRVGQRRCLPFTHVASLVEEEKAVETEEAEGDSSGEDEERWLWIRPSESVAVGVQDRTRIVNTYMNFFYSLFTYLLFSAWRVPDAPGGCALRRRRSE